MASKTRQKTGPDCQKMFFVKNFPAKLNSKSLSKTEAKISRPFRSVIKRKN